MVTDRKRDTVDDYTDKFKRMVKIETVSSRPDLINHVQASINSFQSSSTLHRLSDMKSKDVRSSEDTNQTGTKNQSLEVDNVQ